ncbi:MAG: hypothetical protein M1820_004513 [Bogoriella megaspora]|nr:MAG: hypothetical protein M1820_004513 [Bogoriella megaspora]
MGRCKSLAVLCSTFLVQGVYAAADTSTDTLSDFSALIASASRAGKLTVGLDHYISSALASPTTTITESIPSSSSREISSRTTSSPSDTEIFSALTAHLEASGTTIVAPITISAHPETHGGSVVEVQSTPKDFTINLQTLAYADGLPLLTTTPSSPISNDQGNSRQSTTGISNLVSAIASAASSASPTNTIDGVVSFFSPSGQPSSHANTIDGVASFFSPGGPSTRTTSSGAHTAPAFSSPEARTTHPPLMTLNGKTYTADRSSDFVIEGQTLAPGNMIVVSGAQLYYPSNSSAIVFGTSIQSLATSIPSATTTPPLKASNAPVGAAGNSTLLTSASSGNSSASGAASTSGSSGSSTGISASSGSLMGSSPTGAPNEARGMRVGMGSVGAGLGMVMGVMALL